MRIDYSSLLFMLILILLGFCFRKFKLIDKTHIDSLPPVLLNIAYPALIINSVLMVDVKDLAIESIVLICSAIVITVVIFFGGLLILKKYGKKDRKPIFLINMAVGNTTFIALPVVQSIFGNTGVYCAVLFCTAQDMLLWTLYYSYFAGVRNLRREALKRIISPSLAAIVVSILLVLFGIKINGVTADVLKSVGGITIPLALIYIGGIFAEYNNISDLLPDRDTIIISAVKVLILPLAVFGALQFVPISLGLRILISIMFAPPEAVVCVIWSKQFGCDNDFSMKVLIFSTIFFFILALVLFSILGLNSMLQL